MKPFKHLACLVTLSIACGLPLKADTSYEYREWSDSQGRKITARFLRMESVSTVEIERKNEKLTYIIPVSMLSAADRKYLDDIVFQSELKIAPSLVEIAADMKTPDEAFWTLLGTAGSLPSLQSETKFPLVLELMNHRFAAYNIKSASGKPLSIRTEPADLADRISVPLNMDRMRMDHFMREIARRNDISVKIDGAGMIVLFDTAISNRAAGLNKRAADIAFNMNR